MEYGEFWLLDRAVERPVRLSLVSGPRKYLEAQWNRPWHGLDRDGVVARLERLQAEGAIEALDDEWKPVTITRDEWNDELDKSTRLSKAYGLTLAGGGRWESFAEANWDRYHSFDRGDEALEVAATSPSTAERAFEYAVQSNRLRVRTETLTRGEYRPWQATYWKSLPEGYFVGAVCEDVSVQEEYLDHLQGGLSEAELKVAAEWYRQERLFFRRWYNQHPDTPRMKPYC